METATIFRRSSQMQALEAASKRCGEILTMARGRWISSSCLAVPTSLRMCARILLLIRSLTAIRLLTTTARPERIISTEFLSWVIKKCRLKLETRLHECRSTMLLLLLTFATRRLSTRELSSALTRRIVVIRTFLLGIAPWVWTFLMERFLNKVRVFLFSLIGCDAVPCNLKRAHQSPQLHSLRRARGEVRLNCRHNINQIDQHLLIL